MPVFAEGSTTKMPAHSEEAMPCMAEMADILSDPGVCWVALLSSAGRTTLMVDDALGLDNPRIAISFLHGETIVSYRLDERIVGSVSHALSVCFDLDSGEPTVLYCTVHMRCSKATFRLGHWASAWNRPQAEMLLIQED